MIEFKNYKNILLILLNEIIRFKSIKRKNSI